jgi:hypothetical protein
VPHDQSTPPGRRRRRKPRRRGFAKTDLKTLLALTDQRTDGRVVRGSTQVAVLVAVHAYQHWDATTNRTADRSTATLAQLAEVAHLERKAVERAISVGSHEDGTVVSQEHSPLRPRVSDGSMMA